MVWFKVDDNLAFHRKSLAAGNSAMGLWVRAGSYCAQQLTDGFVPDEIVPSLGTFAQASRLVLVEFWSKTSGGFMFHDWHTYQPTRAEIEADRARSRERVKAWRERKTQTGVTAYVQDTYTVGNAVGNGERTPLVTVPRPDPTRPVVPSELPIDASQRPTKRKTKTPDLLPITEAMTEWAKANGITCDLAAATAQMLDHHRAKGSTMIDWTAAWRTWMSNTKRFGGPEPTPPDRNLRTAWMTNDA